MPYAFLALAVIGLIASTGFTAIVLYAVPGYLRERRRELAQLQASPGFTPPLSLLKPLHGSDPGLEAFLETFFQQDYPTYEVLFCTRSPDDPGLAIAKAVAARHPAVPAKFLSTNGHPDYINAKVASLELMESAASHDILVISDSDVRVTPGYLRAIALPFADPQVGGLTCPYRGVAAEGGIWARLEAVGMSVEMTAGVLAARAMEGMQFVLGPTMAFRRATIRKIGGFKVTADYCADDFILGNETFKAGETIVLSHHSIDHMVINARFADSIKHQVRWMKSTRFSRPAGHFGTALTFSVPYGLLALAAAVALGHTARGFAFFAWGLALFAWSLATALSRSLAVGRAVVQDSSWLALLILYPLRDLMGLFFWIASYGGSKIVWRGRLFQLLPGGKMRAAK
jgi:ceramide glucosyltransferase